MVPRDGSELVATADGAETTDAEIERAIVAAMLAGRGAVAELLAAKLRAGRHQRAGVASIEAERARRR